MDNKLQKRYGLFTAIAMIVGIVIGSGIFFKAQSILIETNGNISIGILAWILGGIVMLNCVLAFSNIASKYSEANGVIGYAQIMVGSKYSYYVGWFMATIFYPSMAAVVAWTSARFTNEFINAINPNFPWAISPINDGLLAGPECMIIAAFYLIGSFCINSLSPKLAGKLQVSTTIIKLIPLLLMGIVGTIYGIKNGVIIDNLNTKVEVVGSSIAQTSPLLMAVVSTAFAYEGWIVATSISSEIKNAKRNLPLALILGSIIIITVYVTYYIGVVGGANINEIIEKGAAASFNNIFGNAFGTFLFVFIIISSLGTLNGIMLACCRGMYSLSIKNQGPSPKLFNSVDKITGIPANSSIIGLMACAIWLIYFYGSNLTSGWFDVFDFDISELPIITIYTFYIPILIMFIVKEKKMGIVKRFIIPSLAICSCIFMIIATIFSHGVMPYLEWQQHGEFRFPVLFYLIVFFIIMLIGELLNKKNNTNNNIEN